MRAASAPISAEAGSVLRGSDSGLGSAEVGGGSPACESSGSSGGSARDGIEFGLTPLVSLSQ
jgi:hypothetical protein